MAPETKAKAKAKLAALKVGVGYPDRWRDYSAPEDRRRGRLRQRRSAPSSSTTERNLRKLGQPVDRAEWVMTPQTVNAVNLPAMNALNFPAAILQPPYFDPKRPAAMDYGAIGAIIGHEISHSFDDQGALFDASGRCSNWWTPEDLSTSRPPPTSSSAVRRLRALPRPPRQRQADAEREHRRRRRPRRGLRRLPPVAGRKPAPVVQGLTGDQQFFLSFAQSWREKTREPRCASRSSPTATRPRPYRADTVRNLDPWYAAFDVKPGPEAVPGPGGPREGLVAGKECPMALLDSTRSILV